jgi:hypothetical protein
MNISLFYARRSLALLASALLATLALLALTSSHNRAAADPYPPTSSCAISTLNRSVQPGDTINLQGSGFPANNSVSLKVDPGTTALGSVHTDANGSFAKTVTIPSSLTGSNHTIVASSGSVTCAFDPFGTRGVDAASTTSRAPTSGVEGLATTGFATLTASVIAVALLAGGALLLLLGRRRRQL